MRVKRALKYQLLERNQHGLLFPYKNNEYENGGQLYDTKDEAIASITLEWPGDIIIVEVIVTQVDWANE